MIIGFNGQMGSGKSTAIEFLQRTYAGEHNFTPVANVKFAQTLYDIQEYIYNTISPVYKRPPDFVKDRKLLQWIGTDWARNSISETLWVDLWKARVREYMINSPRTIVVCDDVRFDNEAETVHSLGGYVVKINCDRTDKRIDTTAGIKHHASEAGINSKLVDYEISNNGTISEFRLAIRNLVGLIETKERYK